MLIDTHGATLRETYERTQCSLISNNKLWLNSSKETKEIAWSVRARIFLSAPWKLSEFVSPYSDIHLTQLHSDIHSILLHSDIHSILPHSDIYPILLHSDIHPTPPNSDIHGVEFGIRETELDEEAIKR